MTETVQQPAATQEGEAATTLLGQEAPQSNQQQATTETAASEATAETKATETGAVPERYEFKAPEGVEFDAGVLSAYEAFAKESKLSQDAAQKGLDSMAAALAKSTGERVQSYKDGLAKQSREDTEFGGAKLGEALGVAQKALTAFGNPALRKLLEESGLGNHPEMIRAWRKVGLAISPDKVVVGNGAQSAPERDPASVLYPDHA